MPVDRRYFKSGAEIRRQKLTKASALEILKDVPDQEIPHTYTRACFHNRKGICYFVSNDPDPCHGICPNWKTYSKSFIRSLGKSREYMDWYMLVKHALVRNESRAIVQTMFMETEHDEREKDTELPSEVREGPRHNSPEEQKKKENGQTSGG